MTRKIEEIDKVVKEELVEIFYLIAIFILGLVTGIATAAYASVH